MLSQTNGLSGAKTWNEIPNNIRMSHTISLFNRRNSYKVNRFPKHDLLVEQQCLCLIFIIEFSVEVVM